MLPESITGETEHFINMLYNVFGAFFNTFGRVFRFPAVGRYREETELALRSIDKFSTYIAKNVEFQHLIYTTGLKAMERVTETIASRLKEGGGIKSFDEFLSLWVDVNEKTYLELFRTEEFSRMQAQLLDAALDVRRHMNELMELYLKDFPVALRSEVDDLARTVYDWRRRVYDLEKRVKAPGNGQYAQIRSEMDEIRKKVDDLYAGTPTPAQTEKRGRRVKG
jgi:class III poly(R)-hydroxyalkanoic acid synthase PhaE subunit